MYKREDGELGSEELCWGRRRPHLCPPRMSLHTVLEMGKATLPHFRHFEGTGCCLSDPGKRGYSREISLMPELLPQGWRWGVGW